MPSDNMPASTSPRAIAWCLIALLPLATAVGFDAVGTRPRPIATGSTPRPGLAFDQYLVNLGSVPAQAEHRAFFAFTNTGSSPITITALRPSCGCLDPRLPKTPPANHPAPRNTRAASNTTTASPTTCCCD